MVYVEALAPLVSGLRPSTTALWLQRQERGDAGVIQGFGS